MTQKQLTEEINRMYAALAPKDIPPITTAPHRRKTSLLKTYTRLVERMKQKGLIDES